MSRLDEIQNELAIEKGFEDFNHMLENTHEMEIIKAYFNKASIKYADECCNSTLQKAYQESLIDGNSQSRCGCEINEESITNPENITLL